MISLIHPSRKRPQQAFDTYNLWMSRASGCINIEHILSIDHSDFTAPQYIELFKHTSFIVQMPNTCVVEAANHGASRALGNILIYLSDDFEAPQDWDLTLHEIIGSDPMLLKVSDGVTAKHLGNETGTANILTIPIMNRALYEKLGYFFHPDYKSMFCDEDLFQTCVKNNWLVRREDLLFPHNHWVNGKAKKDQTYIDSEKNFQTGRQVFEQRKLLGFTL